MTPEQLSTALSKKGLHPEGGESDTDLFIRSRRQALHDRIAAETKSGPMARDELVTRLLPHIDPAVHSPLLRAMTSKLA